ncbi:hypothetical protein Q757_04060 [Oenococcus alcoholitolerans]|uniref:Uncharacterized protein n=1 Tax=Oenococcus alcoholitolerans TaxID=931074 RepID=A0ABR4XR20_9LACO|nr:hypothetical protein Q757_04060 [Oenococcus alcoholitolerans]
MKINLIRFQSDSLDLIIFCTMIINTILVVDTVSGVFIWKK